MSRSFQAQAPLDFQTEQEALARRRRMAEVMAQQAAQPLGAGQMVGNVFVRPSITQGLAKLFQAYNAGQELRNVDRDAQDAARRENEDRASEIGNILGALQGTTRTVEGMPDEYGMPVAQTEAVPADPRRAITMALASSRPGVQNLGGALFSAELARQKATERPENPFSRINPSDYTPESIQAFVASGSRDYTLLRPRVRLDFQNTGGQIVGLNPYTGEVGGQPIRREMTPGESARLQWDQFTWNNLSPEQRARLQLAQAGVANEAARVGIDRTNLFFNTGMAPVGGGSVPRLNLPPVQPFAGGMPQPAMPGGAAPMPQPPMPGGTAPMPQPAPALAQGGGAPMAGAGMPARPAPAGALPAQPVGAPQAVPPAMQPGVTPKAAAQMAAETAERQALAQRNFPNQVRQMANTVDAIDRALGSTGYLTTGVIGSGLSMVPGTSARDLQSALATVRGRLAFDELERMRAASPTGGALGSVTERELTLLESAVQNLDQAQSPEALRNALERVRTHYVNWATALAQGVGAQPPRFDRPAPPAGVSRQLGGGRNAPAVPALPPGFERDR